jgi:hypothetical protein
MAQTEKVTYENMRDVLGGTGVIAGITLIAAAGAATAVKLYDASSLPTILSATAGGDFENQPSGGAITLESSDESDTHNVTVYGTTDGADTVVTEVIALTGTTPVTTIKDDWGSILGFESAADPVGTLTFKNGENTITTIAHGSTSAGVATPTSSTASINTYPEISSSDTSTAPVGLVGADENGTTIYDSQELSGIADLTQQMNMKFKTVTKVLVGAVPAAQNATVIAGTKEEVSAAAGTCQHFIFDPPIRLDYGCFASLDQAGSLAVIHVA